MLYQTTCGGCFPAVSVGLSFSVSFICVAKGKSHIKTTMLVDTGIYAIIRHPQFISWPTFSAALMLIVQQWLVVALGAASIVLFCKDFREVDSSEIEKFGDEYRDYMERVPGWNPVAGVWRWIRRESGSDGGDR